MNNQLLAKADPIKEKESELPNILTNITNANERCYRMLNELGAGLDRVLTQPEGAAPNKPTGLMYEHGGILRDFREQIAFMNQNNDKLEGILMHLTKII